LGVRSSDAEEAEDEKMGMKISFVAKTTLLIGQTEGESPKRIRG
jgi:hypothetical protein